MVLKKMYIRQIKQVSVDKRTNVREIECPITTRSSTGPLTWICLICREPGFSRKLTRLVLHIASSFFTVLCLNTIFRDDILSGLNLTRRLLFLDDLLIVNDLVVSRWVTPHCWALWWFVVVRVCSYAYSQHGASSLFHHLFPWRYHDWCSVFSLVILFASYLYRWTSALLP